MRSFKQAAYCCSVGKSCLFATPWTTAHRASLSFTISWSLLKLMSIEPLMPSKHLILCHPLLLLPSIFPSIRVFPNELALHIRQPKYWSFSFNISPSSKHSGLISFRLTDLISLLSKGFSRVFSSTIVLKHQKEDFTLMNKVKRCLIHTGVKQKGRAETPVTFPLFWTQQLQHSHHDREAPGFPPATGAAGPLSSPCLYQLLVLLLH